MITVLRQECRNRKTMAMVSRPPSTIVCCTLLTEFWMPRELSRTISSCRRRAAGSSAARSIAWRTPRGHRRWCWRPAVLTMSRASARSPFSRATFSQLLLAVDHGGDLAQVDRSRPRRATIRSAKLPGLGDAAGDLDHAVVVAALDVAGREVLVLVADRPHDVVRRRRAANACGRDRARC